MPGRTDTELIRHVREGDDSAFAVLYQRHLAAAEHVARTETDNASDREDAVAAAFTSVLQALRSGKGPDRSFRGYLLTAVRRIAQRNNKRATRTPVLSGTFREPASYDEDVLIKAFTTEAVLEAFNSLTHRWQRTLWYLDIHGMTPAAAAPLLGLSPNAVSALVLRAREGLRLAYLQRHTGPAATNECTTVSAQLAAYTRGGLRTANRDAITEHLRECRNCTAALEHLNDIQSHMRTPTTQRTRTR